MKPTTALWIGMGWTIFVMCALFIIIIGGI